MKSNKNYNTNQVIKKRSICCNKNYKSWVIIRSDFSEIIDIEYVKFRSNQ